ncbi:hypothetical protein K4F52_008485 [Lecanicillium sp. MT-2017a]|nr:hypothetical protein K4F52_008485 [Lecanicillium sp. MT-2017a]
MDEELVARQMNECNSFSDDVWTQYWSALALFHVDELDGELEKSGLQSLRKYIQGDADAPPPSPDIYTHLGRGATLLQSTPLGSSSKTAELVKVAPAEQRGPIVALDAASKAAAYLFQPWLLSTPNSLSDLGRLRP